MPDREELLSVVRAIAARLPVDWATIESSASDESLRAAIRELRVISEIADLHHSLPEISPSTLPSSSSSPVSESPTEVAAGMIAPVSERETWGPFTLLERVGRGSFGEVYRAWDSRLDRDIALKLLKHDDASRDTGGSSIIDEGRLLARVHHPNVVTVYGADRIADRVGLWMEYIRGRTLERSLAEQGPFPAAAVIEIGIQTCQALAAVHQAGLLHRDIKAQNVMRQDDGRLVLMDFGAGRERLDQDEAFNSDLAGTPLYLAPEIFDRQAATIQSDIYAVGVLLYHLVTGTYPVTGRTIRELREHHRDGLRMSVQEVQADVPEALARVIDRALAVNPGNRFATADAMAAALAPIEAPVSAEFRANRLAGAALLVGLALAVVVVVLNVGDWRDRVLGRPGQPGKPGGARGLGTIGDQSFNVRQVLLPGEYFELGAPSPDGRYFSFLDNNADVAVKETATGQIRRLTKGGDSEGYADGSPRISSDSRWVAFPWVTPARAFELRVLELTANPDADPQPRVLVRGSDAESYPIEWSRDGSEILSLLEMKDGVRQIALVSTVDGSARKIKELGAVRPLGISLSPDGRFTVYDHPQQDNPRARDLFVVATDGSGEWPLVEHPASDMFPYWTSDGERVLFTSDRTGALGLWAVHVFNGKPVGEPEVISRDMGRMTPIGPTQDGAFYYRLETGLVDVYTANIDPATGTAIGKPEPVWPNRIGSNISSDWSADGHRLAYVKIRNPAGLGQNDPYSRILAIRDVATGQEHELSPALAFFIAPRWSPDSRTILVNGGDLDQVWGLHLVDAGSGRVTAHVQGEMGWPRWARDGQALLYTKNGHALMSRNVATGAETLVADIRTLGVDRFTPTAFGPPFEISPDGRSLAFTGWIGEGKTAHTVIEVLPIGGAAVEVARSGVREPMFFQGWTPDGFDLFFTKGSDERTAPTKLWRISARGGEPRPTGLETLGLRDVHVNADGTKLTFTAGWQTGEVRVMEHFLPR